VIRIALVSDMKKTFRLLVWLLLAATNRGMAQSHVDILRGTVTTDSGAVISGAEVIATMAPDRVVIRSITGPDGRYEIRVPDGSGDYLVHISALGRETLRKRATRVGNDSVLVVDARLRSATHELKPVIVQSVLPRPNRSTAVRSETGSASKLSDGVIGANAPSEDGVISSMAALVPGVTATPSGVSVLGLSADQSQTTLNGLQFAGTDIPREIRSRTRVFTSSYDPARGGFSGAQVAVELSPGGSLSSARGHVTLDAPELQFTDRLGVQLGRRISALDISAGQDGQFGDHPLFYNAAVQIGRTVAPVPSLFTTPSSVWQSTGISPDSVERLIDILGAAGAPLGVSKTRVSPSITDASLMARFDYAPFETFLSPAKQTWGFITYAKRRASDGMGLLPTATPTHSWEETSNLAALQAFYARYWGQNYLTDTKFGVTIRRYELLPRLRFPEGRVDLTSSDGDAGGYASVLFGGSAAESHSNDLAWEATSETQFYANRKSVHKVKLYLNSRLDRYSDNAFNNSFGTFTFNSLAALSANQPSSFSRVLGFSGSHGGKWTAAAAIGDLWSRSPTLSFLYGIRLEKTAFVPRPPLNSEIAQLFVERTDVIPGNTLGLSPRFGFRWIYSGSPSSGDRTSFSKFATVSSPLRGVLSGGIGAFRNGLPPRLLSDVYATARNPATMQRLLCLGGSAPLVDWSSYENLTAIPSTCAGGTLVLADTAPEVQLFRRDYTAQTSWRSNLSWTSSFKHTDFVLEGVYSLNLNQPGVTDVNFAGVPRFGLLDEAGRAVFVNAADILQASGLIDTRAARLSDRFAQVLAKGSTDKSISRQLVLSLTPDLPLARVFLRGVYTLSSNRAVANGFTANTASDPRVREWSRGDYDARHQLQFQLGIGGKAYSLTTLARVVSGYPFTPIVAGDINGDGNPNNDRAVVFDPGTLSGTGADRMRALLSSSPARVRECLSRQVGTIARRNSCVGSWTTTLNAQITLDNEAVGRFLHTGKRASASIYLANVPAGFDQLLHGNNLRGWGSSAQPDRVLLRVRGFDPVSNHFLYDVNPKFGTSQPTASVFRTPFRITLDLSLDLGRPFSEQQLDILLKPGRDGRPGIRFTADSLFVRYKRSVPDLYQTILAESDSLLLSESQSNALEVAQGPYRASADSLWRTLSVELADLPDKFDANKALKRQEEVTDQEWEIAWVESKKLNSILTASQLKLLPWPASMLYQAREPLKGIRIAIGR
jgi:hypothetical protein